MYILLIRFLDVGDKNRILASILRIQSAVNIFGIQFWFVNVGTK